MARHNFKVRDRIRVRVGSFIGGTGRFVWFDPDKNEIEKVEEY